MDAEIRAEDVEVTETQSTLSGGYCGPVGAVVRVPWEPKTGRALRVFDGCGAAVEALREQAAKRGADRITTFVLELEPVDQHLELRAGGSAYRTPVKPSAAGVHVYFEWVYALGGI